MKTGTEDKTKVGIAVLLVVVAILTAAWTLMPGRPSNSAPAAAAVSPEKGKAVQPSESLDPRLRLDLLAGSERVKYEGKGTNIFRVEMPPVDIPQPKISPLTRLQELAKQNAPPPPPPITLKFFGISSSRGERPKVFLSQGEDVWIAHEGDVVNRHYKIVRISPTAVEVEDLLNNNRQSIQLTQG